MIRWKIIINKDIRTNSNRITNLREPTYPHEVANKLYVDIKPRKVLHGYVPDFRTNSGEPNNKLGFVVTASSYHSNMLQPTNVFNSLYTSDSKKGYGGEWTTNGESRDFW